MSTADAHPSGPDPAGTPDGSIPQEPGIFARIQAAGYHPDPEEAQAAMLTHMLAAALAFGTCGLLGPLGAVLGLLFSKERKPFLLFHVNQALLFQLVILGAEVALGVVQAAFSFLSIGCLAYLLTPLFLVVWMASVGLSLVTGLAARDGVWRTYPVLGEKVLQEWKPLLT